MHGPAGAAGRKDGCETLRLDSSLGSNNVFAAFGNCGVGGSHTSLPKRSRAGLWSWPAFFWTLPLVLVYCAWCAGAVLFFMATGANPALTTGLILAAIFVGVVPLAIVAKRIYRHYVNGAR